MSTSILVEDPNDPGTYLITSATATTPGGSGGYPYPETFPTKLVWNAMGNRLFEVGVDRGVLYLEDLPGVVWDGLISVKESPSGGSATPYYIDGYKYANPATPEEWGASVEAYTYPAEFSLCDGTESMANGLYITQQQRKSFCLSYRTLIGNDVDGVDHGYKIHIVYDAQANPTDKAYATVANTTEASTFGWQISSRPRKFQDPTFGVKYGSHLILDSTKIYPDAMRAIEQVLYGTEVTEPRIPSPQEILTLFSDNALLQITDNGDGTWTASGPDSIVSMTSDVEFQINWPSAVPLDADTYQISSY